METYGKEGGIEEIVLHLNKKPLLSIILRKFTKNATKDFEEGVGVSICDFPTLILHHLALQGCIVIVQRKSGIQSSKKTPSISGK